MASEPIKIADQIRFGEDFELDSRAYELRRAGKALKLERIPMDLLLLLIEKKWAAGHPRTDHRESLGSGRFS